MTSLLDLHILRRIAEADCRSMASIVGDCDEISNVDLHVRELENAGLIRIELKPTAAGLAALKAEPKVARDKPMLTNR